MFDKKNEIRRNKIIAINNRKNNLKKEKEKNV
jgi:hypothetical protein